MKNYFLTKELLLELMNSSRENKETIASKLEHLLKKNECLFASVISINQILNEESNLEKRKIVFHNLNQVLEKILPLDKDDLPLALSLAREFQIDHETATELVIATKNQMDCIVDTSEKFKFQKMISVISLIFKTEKNTI